MGIIPLWGFQLIIAISLSIFLRLNKALVIIAANISIPPMIPVIIYLSYRMGSLWLGDKAVDLSYNSRLSVSSITRHLEQYIYGSITLAFEAGIIFGLLTFVILKLFERKIIAG